MTAPARPQRAAVADLAVTIRRPEGAADGGGDAVVLVHGAMDRAASFSRVMRRLPRHTTVAVDRAGYGDSRSTEPDPDLDAAAQRLLEVVEWTGADRVVLVGHSMGGLVAVRAAERCGGAGPLVAVGSFEAPMPWSPGYGADGSDTLEVAARDGSAAAAEAFYRSLVGEPTWTRLREADRLARRGEGPALVADLETARRPSGSWRPERFRVPVHSARGARSPGRLRRAAAALAADAGTPLVEIDGAGHGAHLSHPDRFAAWVASLT